MHEVVYDEVAYADLVAENHSLRHETKGGRVIAEYQNTIPKASVETRPDSA